ncbi:Polb, partial [Symbiodinium necroappetens]
SLQQLPPNAAEAAAARAAAGSAPVLTSRGPEASEVPAARSKRTLSGYFVRSGEETSQAKAPRHEVLHPPAREMAAGQQRHAAVARAADKEDASASVDSKTGNERIASIFEEMSVIQKLRRDRFRSQAYAKAAQALRAHQEPIASGAQAKGIPGIGSGMAGRIDVILATGELSELDELKRDSDVIALRELRSVHGIGAVRAAELVERGIRSLLHLREAVAKNQVHLDAAQVVGLRHCEEFAKRIPYAEMKEHHHMLEACRLRSNPKLLLTVCGSYRRERPDCGDIDVLISHPDYTTAKRDANAGGKLLHAFVEALKHGGYVTADLAFGNTKFMGVCRLSGDERLHRRLDIRCLPNDQYHFGMLYFTGSAALGVKMRLKAIELGLTLSEYGLENRKTGEKVKASCEQDIFRCLATAKVCRLFQVVHVRRRYLF